MPAPRDPNKPEFYVYHLTADGLPFYVGIGRSARASDRVRYVRYLMRREALGKAVKWSIHTRVLSALLRAGADVQVFYRHADIVRKEALRLERIEIDALLEAGHVLANIQHNPLRPKTAEQVVVPVLAKSGRGVQEGGSPGKSESRLKMQYSEASGSVDVLRPLIYLWEILDADGQVSCRYVGKASRGAQRPRNDYRRNVNNLLQGRPYRKGKPLEFRAIHLRMAQAVRAGESLKLSFLCNVGPDEEINAVERHWQDRFGLVNGHAF